ncbi:MAG: ribonuclease P protein component [Candidatus Taylorbacteria bacterium]
MLPRSVRLTKEQFNSVMEKGRAYHSTLFMLRVVPASSPAVSPESVSGNVGKRTPLVTPTHIAASIPSKVSKKAVDRNRMRRKIYEAIKPFYKIVAPNHYVVVFGKSTALTVTQSQLEKDVRDIFVKAGLLR